MKVISPLVSTTADFTSRSDSISCCRESQATSSTVVRSRRRLGASSAVRVEMRPA
jgi:hypothetical protein